MAFRLERLIFFVFFSTMSISQTSSHNPHPLDSLTPSEFLQIQKAIANHYPTSQHNLTFHYVGVQEPHKPTLLSWLSSEATKTPRPPRCAFVMTRIDHRTHELIIDLSSSPSTILSDKIYNGKGYPLLNTEEQTAAWQKAMQYPPFSESIKQRGLDISKVICSTYSAGWFGEKKSARVVKILCYYTNGTLNIYMRPIEGITMVFDLDRKEVTQYRDRVRVALPKAEGTEYRATKQKPPFGPLLTETTMVQPDNSSFEMDGSTIRWANWKFHLSFDVRAGPVISLASIYDLEKQRYRQVLYKGYISELFVPYMDPTEEWFFRTYLDAGEFGLGLCAVPLQPFTDCPANAVFFDQYYAGQDGKPIKAPNTFCIFERQTGDAMWRHTETAFPGKLFTEVRPEVTLVVRMVTTIGNYDYVLDWEFKPCGAIDLKVGLSGILQVKGAPYQHKDQIKEEVYGTILAENTLGIRHDHYLTYRLDLDVDGEANSFSMVNLEMRKLENSTSPRKSYWTVVSKTAQTESDARVQFGSKPAEFVVINPSKKTKVGNNVGYRLIPGASATPLMSNDDYPEIRGSFTKHHLWVTPYNESEKWAGGLMVDDSRGDDTLSIWSLRDREIIDRDIVLWYTMGFHHVPYQEDFPIMPTIKGEFQLRPANFFDSNPVLKAKTVRHAPQSGCPGKP